jgi:antitoxin component of RelBE/YafQ-DinJ toxin-antitoxin module
LPIADQEDSAVLEKKSTGLTLDRAVRLLRSALAERELPLELAIALVEYHARRNEIAKASHDKAWYAKHGGVKFLLL